MMSFEVIWPPCQVCGNRRPSLVTMTGFFGCKVPSFSSVWETLALAVRPRLEKLSTASPLDLLGKTVPPYELFDAPLVPPPESSLTPNRPIASIPKPTVPWV
ncbi:hypothetical protein D3C87_1812620 [compost metagenome]